MVIPQYRFGCAFPVSKLMLKTVQPSTQKRAPRTGRDSARLYRESSRDTHDAGNQIGCLFRQASYSMTLCPYSNGASVTRILLIDEASSHEDACLGLSVPLASVKTYAL